MNKINKNKAFALVPVLALALFTGSFAHAEDKAPLPPKTAPTPEKSQSPSVIGRITSISERTITIVSKDGTTYTVDVVGSKVFKKTTAGVNKDTATVSATVSIGDNVAVLGTLTGTIVTNTTMVYVMQYNAPMPPESPVQTERGGVTSQTPAVPAKPDMVKKSAEFVPANPPVLTGKIATVTDGKITIVSKDATYTVDTAKAKIFKRTKEEATPTLAVDDIVGVFGKLDGTTVSATTMIYVMPQETEKLEQNEKKDDGKKVEKIPLPNKQPALIGKVIVVTEKNFTLVGRDGKKFVIDPSKAVYVRAEDSAVTKMTATLRAEGAPIATPAPVTIVVGDSVAVFGIPRDTSFVANRIITGLKAGESDMRKTTEAPKSDDAMMMIPDMTESAPATPSTLMQTPVDSGVQQIDTTATPVVEAPAPKQEQPRFFQKIGNIFNKLKFWR